MKTKAQVSFKDFRLAVAERLKLDENNIKIESEWVKDVGISSVDLVKIVMLIRKNYGIKVPATLLGKMKTVEDTFKIVQGA